MKEILKEIPNEIILLSYFQAYMQVYGCSRSSAPTLCFLPHELPNLFEHILDSKKQFEIYDTLCAVENEKIAKKKEVLQNQGGDLGETFSKLDEIEKDYEFKRDRYQKLWSFITAFNKNLKENSTKAKLERLGNGMPIIKSCGDNHTFASTDLVFGIQKQPWGEQDHIVYTKNDKATYDKLFGRPNPKTKN